MTQQLSTTPDHEPHRQRFSVSFEYPVYFTDDCLALDNPVLRRALCEREPERRQRVFCVVDAGVWQSTPTLGERLTAYFTQHAAQLQLIAPPLVVEGGEGVKQSPAVIERLQARMHELGVDRHAFVMIIGGGAVLDAVGFAAATTHRGVRVLRLPTTVLGQNDAGIGVKNGINAFGAKNFLGSFAPPWAVVNDSAFLATLPARDLRAGMAEAIKVALIRDARLFDWLVSQADALARFEPVAMQLLIRRAAELHLHHIASAGDPFELGSARPLDFGHWAAHKLESLSAHRLRHGEAVAIGMAIDSHYSVSQGLLSERELHAIVTLLHTLGFRLWDEALATLDEHGKPAVLRGLADFREHLGGELTVTLLTAIGRTLEVHSMNDDQVCAALRWLQTRDRDASATAL